jgi:hypothetical protein
MRHITYGVEPIQNAAEFRRGAPAFIELPVPADQRVPILLRLDPNRPNVSNPAVASSRDRGVWSGFGLGFH